MKKFFIKILPFLVAFLTGILLYVLTNKFVSDSGLNNLMINIASGLVSIPLVFIFYDGINQITSRNLHNLVFESVTVEINNQLIELMHIICDALKINYPSSLDELDDFLDLDENEIYQNFTFKTEHIENLKKIKKDLQEAIHKQTSFEILSEKQILAVLNIVKEMTFLIKNINLEKEGKKSSKHKRALVMNLAYIINNLAVWIESGKKDAFHNHARFSFTEVKK